MRLRSLRRRSAATVASSGALQRGRFGDVQTASGLDFDSGWDLVPTAQLIERNTKSVGNGDQGVTPSCGVKQGMQRGRSHRRHGHDESFDAGDALVLMELVGGGEVTN